MKHVEFVPTGVCSRLISFDLSDDYPFSDYLSVLGLRMLACAKAFKSDRYVTLLSAIENRPSSGYILSPGCTQYFFMPFFRIFLNFSPI